MKEKQVFVTELERRLQDAIELKMLVDVFSGNLMRHPIRDHGRLPTYSESRVLHVDSKGVVHLWVNGRYKLMPFADLGGIRMSMPLAIQAQIKHAA